MNEFVWHSHWFIWSGILVLGFPTLLIVLGEFIYRLQRRSQPLAATLRFVRNLLLPLLVFLLFVVHVLEIDPQGDFVKLVQTLLWVCAINAVLSSIDIILFAQARADTWRAQLPKLFVDLSRLFFVLLGSAIVLATVWNADLAGLVTALGVGSVVIGLALQDTLGSLVSGIALLMERPFSVGDWIHVGELEGQVTELNWRSVRLVTHEGDLVVIPHTQIGSETIQNESQPPGPGIENIQMGFSYDDPPNLVKQVLKGIALETPGILTTPEPEVHTLGYNDYSISYDVRFYIEDYGRILKIRDELMTRIWYAAKRNNLTIPLPTRTVHLFEGSAYRPDNGASQKFAESLHSIPQFMSLAREQEKLDDLAKDAVLQNFGAGEKVIRLGDRGHALYIIVAGLAKVTLKNDTGKEQEVMTLGRGEFFGEITLFTGEPSPIAVTAAEDLEVVAIDAEALNRTIEKRPSLAREIGQAIEARKRAVEMAKQVGSLLYSQSKLESSERLMLNDLLRQVSFFQGCSDLELQQIVAQGYRKTLSSGEILCRENDPGDSFYIILGGAVEVFVESIGKRVAVRQAGEFIGEMSLLLGTPRTATLRTLGKTVLFVVDQANLKNLLANYRELADKISQELATRQDTLKSLGIQMGESDTEETPIAQIRQRIQSIFGI